MFDVIPKTLVEREDGERTDLGVDRKKVAPITPQKNTTMNKNNLNFTE